MHSGEDTVTVSFLNRAQSHGWETARQLLLIMTSCIIADWAFSRHLKNRHTHSPTDTHLDLITYTQRCDRGVAVNVGVIWLRLWAGLLLKAQGCLIFRPFFQSGPQASIFTMICFEKPEDRWNHLYRFLLIIIITYQFLLWIFPPILYNMHQLI